MVSFTFGILKKNKIAKQTNKNRHIDTENKSE